MLNSCEPEIGWRRFKHRLFELADKHIPKATVKSEFQPPWFDSECYDACRKKERLRAKFKQPKNDSDGLKFSLARKEFKKLVSQKMRETLFEDDDTDLITKKLWSHVKTASNSHRISEFITYNLTMVLFAVVLRTKHIYSITSFMTSFQMNRFVIFISIFLKTHSLMWIFTPEQSKNFWEK